MKRILLVILLVSVFFYQGFSQKNESPETIIRFRGLVMDANTLTPIPNSHILIDRNFSAISDKRGNFAFYAKPNDTVIFRSLGYKLATVLISDTLIGHEYLTAIYLRTDTLPIGEVVIMPKFPSLKYEILNAPSRIPLTIDYARYNVEISAYNGKMIENMLGDPAANYDFISRSLRTNAFEKGTIPSERIIGLNPLLLVPGVYILLHGLPESPPPFVQDISNYELDKLNRKFLESLNKGK